MVTIAFSPPISGGDHPRRTFFLDANITQVNTTMVDIVEGVAYMESSKDGPVVAWDYYVGIAVGEKDYVHPHGFRYRRDADKFLATIRQAGAVDLTQWIEKERMSLEDRFSLYAEREDEVRHGFRSEADMYHGIPTR